jgi:hypothetical protein
MGSWPHSEQLGWNRLRLYKRGKYYWYQFIWNGKTIPRKYTCLESTCSRGYRCGATD